MYSVYVLQSLKDDTYYVGYSSDIKRRLHEHNLGKVRYTKGHLPYRVVYCEEYESLRSAKAREIKIKASKNISYFLKKMGSPDRQTS